MTQAPEKTDLVNLTVDGVAVSVPKDTLVIRAAEQVGVQIPRFCDHPLLAPVGACRQCLVDVPDAGNGRPFPKPQASCTLPVAEGMVVNTQATSPVADKAQQGIMEFLLINHPLDCPVCDKGGECPLQNQAMTNGRGESRFTEIKRTYPKPINISSQVLLDRERCVLCARCTRFSAQVAGDPFIEMLERGALQQVGIYEKEPFQSYFSGNTVQICPVGALTGAAYRFRSRPFDLVSSPGVCEHCASGCAIRTDHRRGKVLRRLAGDDPQVNEEWNCDKGRWAFQYATAQDRLTSPLVRDEDGVLVPASWGEALDVAARGLGAARGATGVLVGGRSTLEDAYAYAKLARAVLATNDVDFRARPHSAEEESFLGAHVAGYGLGVTYDDLESASTVLLVGLEPEEESPILFLRLRKAVRRGSLTVHAVSPLLTRGLEKLSARLLPTAPGTEAEVLDALRTGDSRVKEAADALAGDDVVILVGEGLASVPGALSAVVRLAEATGAGLEWVPRRAGERGAVEAGALPSLLPGGRPVADAPARVDVATAWGVDRLPEGDGRDTDAILAAVHTGEVRALLVGGVDPHDLPDPTAALAALDAARFVVSLELRESAVTERADVVLPVAAAVEKAGTFVTWEGRQRPFEAVLRGTNAMPDVRVLDALADAMGADLGLPDVAAARAEIHELGGWDGAHAAFQPVDPVPPAPASLSAGRVVLATWPTLLDSGRLQDGEPYLAGTARRAVARLSATTAEAVGVTDGAALAVSTDRGELTAPAEVTEMPDGVVWLPTNSDGVQVRLDLGAAHGSRVRIRAAGGDQ
ncbi:MAG TPA: NADH-quinone oxidoreductase subunit G [Actinomycetes bacterium]|nr:NADH-quinone oxidoreductase subunit G [Actinomycetes bacterium]